MRTHAPPLPLYEPGDLFLNASALDLAPWWFVNAAPRKIWNRGLDTLSFDGILIESGLAADASDKGISQESAEDTAGRRR